MRLFSLLDWLRLFLAALFILPMVTIIRELGYYIAATVLGGTNKKLIVGSGPTLFKVHTLEVRRYFFMYSWMEYDELRPSTKGWHILIYASPILTTSSIAIVVNWLVFEGHLPDNMFWTTFIFYCFYFVLFDLIPVYLPDGQPTNGRAIFDLIWHGERSDYKKEQEKEEKVDVEEKRSNTEAQEETMENRDRDDDYRKDHTDTKDSQTNSDKRSHTKNQEKTMQNRDRDEKERGDHTNPK